MPKLASEPDSTGGEKKMTYRCILTKKIIASLEFYILFYGERELC
jgi:hypothetical protein